MNVAVIDTCIPPQCIFLLFLHYMSLRSVTGSYDAEEFIYLRNMIETVRTQWKLPSAKNVSSYK